MASRPVRGSRRACRFGLALYEEECHAHHRYVYFGHDPAVCALACGAGAQWVLGYSARSMCRHDEAVALARRLRDAPSLEHSLMFVCDTSQKARSDPMAILATATELRELSEQHGFSQFQAYGLMFGGWAVTRSGDTVQG